MIKKIESLVWRFHKEQHGQMLVMSAVSLMLLLAVACLAVDFAQVYVGYHQLKASTDAAAMAGAENLSTLSPTYASVQNTALLYSSVPASGNNTFNNLTNVSMASGYPLPECLTTLTNPPYGIACISLSGAPKGSGGTANAVQVRQQATIPLSFAGLFGMGSVTIYATSTASMRGGLPAPYNVAIIIDTTASMGSQSDGGSNCASPYTKISCALQGVQTLMVQLAPCQMGIYNCSSNQVDQVALFTFPPIQTSTAQADYCGGGTIKTGKYANPLATGYSYQLVPPTGGFAYDYLSGSSTLNQSSHLVQATNVQTTGYNAGQPTCMGTPGGAGTYYAGVIYAAQAALVSAQTANPNTSNVLIILSDGDATATSPTEMVAPYNATKGQYFSPVDECKQAVVAAQAASAAGTMVYSIAYGANASGCSSSTDSNPSGMTPCATMQGMASKSTTFYTDATSKTKGGCISTAQQSVTKLSDIFTSIAGQLWTAKLIPNRTT